MKTLLILLLLIVNAYSNVNKNDKLLKEFNDLTVEQKKTMKEVFKYGEKHGMGLELSSIAWKESEFGLNKVSPGGSNVGLTQINLTSYFDRYKIKDNKANRKAYTMKHVKDTKLNLNAAVDELKYWKAKSKSKSKYNKKAWAHYNNGTIINPKGIAYANDIEARIKILEKKIKKS